MGDVSSPVTAPSQEERLCSGAFVVHGQETRALLVKCSDQRVQPGVSVTTQEVKLLPWFPHHAPLAASLSSIHLLPGFHLMAEVLCLGQ